MFSSINNRKIYLYGDSRGVFTLSNAKHGESIASSTSKGPKVKTTEPIVAIKVTNCGIQLGWILAGGGFAKNYKRSRPEAKNPDFFI